MSTMKIKKILFFCRLYYPHIGGVEKQVGELGKRLVKKGYEVTVITEKYNDFLKNKEYKDGVLILRFKVPKIKYIGLFYIWYWLLRNISVIRESDIVHAHSVYIWYWLFRFLFPKKPSYVTFHGWEGKYPIPLKNIVIRKIDAFFSNKNITISDYVEKYYGIKANKLMYTSVDLPKVATNKRKNLRSLLYVGRLDEDTGIVKILKMLRYIKKKGIKIRMDFCGDGPLRNKCEKFGKVHGFVNPHIFYQKAFICLSPGHTSILEAFTYKCLVVTTYNNPVKRDYLNMTPFKNWIILENDPKNMANVILSYLKRPSEANKKIERAYNWVKKQNWEMGLKMYLDLWKQDD